MSLVEIRINGRYKLGQKIGCSSFGDIYHGKNVQSNQDVAIKMELIKKKYQQLIYEANVFQYLQGGIGIPTLYWSGQEGDYNIIVLDLLGKNIEELFNLCERKFTLKSVLMLADQFISNIEYIHFKNYVHRNIKPENFLIGLGKKSHKIFTIDFSLSRIYRDPKTSDHLNYNEHKRLIGTARFASINAHRGIEQTRRDDLESIGYLLLYFLKGSLPWQSIQAESFEDQFNEIKEKKMAISLEVLCGDLPQEFAIFLNYCRNLKFDEKPDYGYLKKIFKELFVRSGYEYDYVYDWLLIPYDKESDDGFYGNQELNRHLEDPNFIDLINEDEEKTIQKLIELSKKKFEKKSKNLSIDSFKNEDFLIEELKKENEFVANIPQIKKNEGSGQNYYGSNMNFRSNDRNAQEPSSNYLKKGSGVNERDKSVEKKKNNKIEVPVINEKGFDKKKGTNNKKKDKDCIIF